MPADASPSGPAAGVPQLLIKLFQRQRTPGNHVIKNNLGWLMLLPAPVTAGRGDGEKDLRPRASDASAQGGGVSAASCLKVGDVRGPEKTRVKQ